jgi:eukaryotic-like serine/threonine-protein kinase
MIPPSSRSRRSVTALIWMIAAFIVVLMAFLGILLGTSLNSALPPAGTPSLAPALATAPLIKTDTAAPSFLPPQSATVTFVPSRLPSFTPSLAATELATQTLTVRPTATLSLGVPDCTTVGQTYFRPIDKMVMVCIPAGSFQMGLDKCTFEGCEKEAKGGKVDLAGYWIDRTEVTNAMFQEFVNQTSYVTGAEKLGGSEVYGNLVAIAGANWRAPQGAAGSLASAMPNHPVVQMNWYSANAYCKWTGGRLPSEAEWEKAARGSDGRIWPWGNALPSDLLMNAADKSVPAPQSRTDQNDGFRYTSPVGAFPAGQSPFGLMDMAGNAWEWTRSIYRDYPYQPNDGREILTAPADGDKPVLRGGCWFDDYGSLRSTMRYGGIPAGSTDGTGFRCVYP